MPVVSEEMLASTAGLWRLRTRRPSAFDGRYASVRKSADILGKSGEQERNLEQLTGGTCVWGRPGKRHELPGQLEARGSGLAGLAETGESL